jgi:PAS domain S-box-containing protein
METKTIKILAIDDIQDNLITLKALISESFKNVNVLTALSGKTGLEIAALENPDVILLDIIMPEMDGYEVCKILKADNNLKEIPVVFITALKGDKATRIKALEVGAEAFLAKPIDESELVAQINAMVKIKEANFEKLNREKLLLDLVTEKTKSLEVSNQKAIKLLDDLTKENEARKLSEQALIESEEKYKELVTKIPDGVFVLRSKPDGSFLFEYVSPKMEVITQIKAQSILENPANAFLNFHPEDLPLLIQANADGIASKEPALIIGRLLIKEKIKWVEISSNPEILADGDILWHGLISDITEQKIAEIELNNTHQKLEVLMDAIPDLLFEVGLDGTIYNYHTHSTDLLAALPEVFLGKRFSEVLPLQAADICLSALKEANEKGISTGKQYSLQLPQGKLWFDVSVAPIKNSDEEITRYVFLARDVTVQKKSVLELVKLNRTQALNSQINDLIIRIHDKMKLFEEVCEIATTYGNFRMSWISEIEEQTKSITPLVWYGHEEGYLNEIQKISIENNLFGNGPTGIAFREGKVSVCNNIATDPKMELWREEALKRGYLSSIALPITVRKKVIGTFNLYAGEVDFFALDEEVELLENITANIAFSLEKILDDEDRLKAEQKIREKDQEFKKLSANVPDLLYQFTRRPDGSYFVPIASSGIINIFGCTPEDVANDFTAIANVIYPEDAERVINDIEQSAANISYFACEFRVQIPGKPIQWIYSKSTPEELADGSITWYGFNTDITERKNAEQKNIESLQIIEGIINTINVRVFWKDKNLKYLGCNKVFALDAGFNDPKDLIGKDDYQMGWKDQADLYRADDLKVIESGETKLNIEEVQTTPDGNIITLLTNKIPIKNSNNETYGVLGTYIDISERKKIEVDLLKSKVYLQTILESTDDGILAVSAHNTLLYNARFIELWKVPQELIDTNNDQILIEFAIKQLIEPQVFLQKVNELYNSNNDSFDILYFKDGRIFERLSRPMHLNGDLHGRVWSFRDITEKRKAEQEKENNISIIRRLSVAIEQSPVTTVITDLDGNIVFVNPKFTETTGYTFEEAKGQNPRILNTGHTSKSKYTDLWQTILAGNNWHGEFKNKKKNGEFFWERATISPVKNEAGEITNFLAVKEDITEQKIAEEAFQKNVRELEDYKFAIDESAIVSMTGNDGIITYANKNFSKISQYSNQELIGSNHRLVNSGYHPKEYFTNMWSLINNGKVWVGELRNKAKDGSFYWVHGTIIPFLDENNKPFRYLSIRFDITERKKAQEGILKSNERYDLVAKATNDSIWDLNILTQEIVRSGNGFEVLFGYKITEDNIDYPHYKNLIHPDDLDRIIASKTKVFNNPNEYNWEQDYRFLKANGEYSFVHDKGFIIRDKNGIAIRMIGATQDITEREKHIKAIEEQNSKLKDIAWLQSHVVRAPLSRMMGIVNLLKEVELNGEEFKEWVGHFNTSSAELDKVIHDISNKSDEFDLKFK